MLAFIVLFELYYHNMYLLSLMKASFKLSFDNITFIGQRGHSIINFRIQFPKL